MPEHIRSLIVILFLSAFFFRFALRYADSFIDKREYIQRKNAWLAITIVAFLSFNFWLFIALLALYYYAKLRNTPNPAALYLFLILALPTGQAVVPGFGSINYLFMFSYQEALTFIILIPAFFSVMLKNKTFKFGSLWTDKFVEFYIVYMAILFIRDTTATDMLRQTFYNVIQIFIPYYVISRSIKSLSMMRDAITSLIMAISLISIFAFFEYLKGWLLFSSLPSILGINDMTTYLGRAGFVRAVATTGQSIALTYTAVIGLLLFMYFREHFTEPRLKKTGLGILLAGAFAGLSRGPWLGAVFGWMCFTLTGQSAFKKITGLATIGVMLISLLLVLPGGEKYYNLIPYIGETEKGNITYREKLFDNSMIVIKRNLWTGSPNYLDNPEMEEMRTGLGIIDIVNTYLGVALESGLIGLTLFGGIFVSALLYLFKCFKRFPLTAELNTVGRALFSAVAATMMIIVTTSPIGMIPVIYWALLGLSAAYVRICKTKLDEAIHESTLQ